MCLRKAAGKKFVNLILGIANVLLAFTYIYFFLSCSIRGSFENIEISRFQDSNALFEYLCYSVSVVMPSSIIISKAFPLSGWSKLATVLQVVLFYGFLLSRLADMLHKGLVPPKRQNDNNTGVN